MPTTGTWEKFLVTYDASELSGSGRIVSFAARWNPLLARAAPKDADAPQQIIPPFPTF